MAMVVCPECGTRISEKARQCPYCGCQSENEQTALSVMPLAKRPTRVIVPQASIFDDGTNLIKPEANKKMVDFMTDAERMAKYAPSVYEAIVKKLEKGDGKYVADFSKKAEELLENGELVFSIDKKTSDWLPQLRRVDNGQIYEKARIHYEEMPKDLMPTVHAVQSQINVNELMKKIEAVSENVSALRLENHADRIAKANSVWAQLQQASLIQDSRLRELKMLSIVASATEARCILEENFKVQAKLLSEGKGNSKTKGAAGNNAMTALAGIALMSRTEYAAYSLLGEDEAAKLSLEQFKAFAIQNKLDDRDTLLQINSHSDTNHAAIVNGFNSIAKSVIRLELEPQQEYAMLPTESSREEAAIEEVH